ncbi:energy-coupled thiamine transporter ThiT [Eubacteriales bacterium OttesenSCG-928-N13]|nr:energy-coupled thiamine transporter ThiT [Eubacteriales bacterium OttesenSCG-928-N13]
MGEWFAGVITKMQEVQWYTWLTVALLFLAGIILILSGRNSKWNSKRLAYAAMCIAISFVLSYIRLFRLPQGGSITLLSTLPIILFSVAFGPVQGFVVGCAYGLLQLLQDMYVIHPIQMLMDYPLGFGALALAGLVNFMPLNKWMKLPVAILLGSLGRLALTTMSGVIFFSSYALELGQAPLIYSLIYNGSYIGVEAALGILVSFIPATQRLSTSLKTA